MRSGTPLERAFNRLPNVVAADLADAAGRAATFRNIARSARKPASFLDFCYAPRLAIEATLQPIRRFGFDAAILFSDILVVPDALGPKGLVRSR